MDQTGSSLRSHNAVGLALAALYDLARHRDPATFPALLARALGRAFNCDSAAYVRVDPAATNLAVSGWPDATWQDMDVASIMDLHARDHPVVARLRASRSAHAWNLHDLIAPEAFRKTALYRQHYRPRGIEYQLAMLLPSPEPGAHAISLHRRHAPFTEDDRELLELLWPNLAQAMRNLRALSRAREASAVRTMVDESGIIVLDHHGHVELCTEQARIWLTRYCAQSFPRRKIELPSMVAEWVQVRLREIEAGAAAALIPSGHREKLVLAQAESFLTVSLIADHGRGQHLLVLEEQSLRVPPATLAGLRLTGRETEVLTWVAQGKTNAEIGMILGMSARTVQKHLEHVFEKLGVESRTAAILKAWQVGRFASLVPR